MMVAEFSYQLYSSRNFPSLDKTLEMVKLAGFGRVEGFDGVYLDLSDLCELLDKYQLAMPSGHFAIDLLEGDPDRVLEIADKTAMRLVICPILAPQLRPGDASGWFEFGRRLQKAGQPFRDAGLMFSWHNHDYELVPLVDGSMPLEHIFKGGPLLSWQVDIAWITRAGENPVDWIKRYGEKIVATHIKDVAVRGQCGDEGGWADVGHGIIDWVDIWSELKKTKAEIFVVEHDNPNDHQRFARRSFVSVQAF